MASDLPGPRSEHLTQRVILAIVAGLLLVLGVTVFFHVRHIRLEEAERLKENDAIARGVAAFIEVREQGYLNTLLAYAGRFRFREAVERNDRAEALVHLRQLGQTFPELDRVFLTNPAGVMWAIYPEAPQVLGRSFAHRDWYQGVSRGWRPYMSEVFQSSRDGALVVGLSVPIRSQQGRVIGIIGSFQRLEVVRQWLLPIHVPDGDLYVVDRKGQFIFHRTRTGPERLSDYARIPVVERLLRGEEGVSETENPVEGRARLSAYRLLPSLGWGVVVQREKNLALQGARTLVLVSGTAGLLLAAALFVLGVVAVGNDRRTRAALSALEEKTRQLENAQEELVRKGRLAILGQLAGGVAHELRNPLGVVKNSVYYLKMIMPSEDRVSKHLTILEREVGTANRIVTGLLDFSRVRPPARAATDLNRLLLLALERTGLGDDIRIVSRLAEDLPPVLVDPEQVGQVLGNLIANAAQAMPEGGTLTLETARANGGILAAVSDTGVGIPPENLGKIFQPLFTTKAKGIGLGLVVAKSLAEANGGAIGVESAPGRGSRFVVHFTRVGEET